MKLFFRHIFIALLLPIIIGSSMQIIAQKQIVAKLEQLNEIDICSKDPMKRQALFGINIGNIERSDSLFGFNFEVSFDTSKLQFNRGIYINTLSEAFNDGTRDVTTGFEPGTIRGYGVHLNFSLPPVSGNKPLIAFLFDYLGNLPETTNLKINYLEFTKEFKKEIAAYEPYVLEVDYIDRPERYTEFSFEKDSLIFDKENDWLATIKLMLKAGKETKISNISFDAVIDDRENFVIIDVNSNPNYAQLLENVSIDNGLRIKLQLTEPITTAELIELKIASVTQDSTEGSIQLQNIEFNPGHCVTRLQNRDIIMLSQKDTTEDTTSTNIEYCATDLNISSSYYPRSDEFIIESNEKIFFASFFDLRGLLLKRIDYNEGKNVIRINASDLSKGIYIIKLIFESGRIKSLMNIKY